MGRPQGRVSPWPRCRWCSEPIEPVTFNRERADNGPPLILQEWRHVATGTVRCAGRSNSAEPIPVLDEEPMIKALYEFIGRHRRLRRSFREQSQSRASALRRLNDYHELVDALSDALDTDPTAVDERPEAVIAAARALRDYRKSTQAAGWR